MKTEDEVIEQIVAYERQIDKAKEIIKIQTKFIESTNSVIAALRWVLITTAKSK
jgi:hypothetical protein